MRKKSSLIAYKGKKRLTKKKLKENKIRVLGFIFLVFYFSSIYIYIYILLNFSLKIFS